MDVYLLLQEFKAFAYLRRRLEPLSMAIFSYGKVNGLLTKQDLKRAAQHVSFLSPSLACLFILFWRHKSKLIIETVSFGLADQTLRSHFLT